MNQKNLSLKEIEKIKTIYYNDNVLNLILKYINPDKSQFREFAILNNPKNKTYSKISFRAITFSDYSISYFKKVFFNPKYDMGILKNDCNLYCSVARIGKLPSFPYDTKERTKETKPFFKNEYIKNIIFYDIFIDTDLYDSKGKPKGTMKDFLLEIKRLLNIINTYNIKSEFTFSGTRGFKFVMFNNTYNYNRTQKILFLLFKHFEKGKYKFIDSVGMSVSSKLMKCTFSLVFKKNSVKICYPIYKLSENKIFAQLLKDKNFDIFNYNYKDIDTFYNLIKVFQTRGYIYNMSFNNNGLIEFVKHLLKKYKEK